MSEMNQSLSAAFEGGSTSATVINLSEFRSEWNWVAHAFEGPEQCWLHATSLQSRLPQAVPRRRTWARLGAAVRAGQWLARSSHPLLVSHGPRPTLYGATMARLRGLKVPHLAYAFNFTDLPTGTARRAMAKAYRQVSRFVVFSTLERELYARHFDLPIERFDMMHWAVQPRDASTEPPVESGDYICALGSQARDYATLFQAMAGLPHIRLVVVAQPENLRDLAVPPNVSLHTAIPSAQAANILAHSRFTVIPLRDSEVPCGHVTIVSAMHAGKAIVATQSAGISDYLKSGVTGALVPARDADALRLQIAELYENPLAAGEMGNRALDFARLYCVESRVVDRMAAYLKHGLDCR